MNFQPVHEDLPPEQYHPLLLPCPLCGGERGYHQPNIRLVYNVQGQPRYVGGGWYCKACSREIRVQN